MSKLASLTPIAAVLAVSLSGPGQASENPFALPALASGTALAAHHEAGKEEKKSEQAGSAADKEGKCGEGKCGSKMNEKAVAPAEKAGKEGKCGEGKCGTKTYGVN
jgi:uncharacterized low-complexity protein